MAEQPNHAATPAQDPDEKTPRKSVADGFPVVCDAIEATLVRELVLGEPAPGGGQDRRRVDQGVLDLVNARGRGGGACNALILERCVLELGGDRIARPSMHVIATSVGSR